MDKAILGKMGGIYVTYVADVDKGQWPLVTLVWSFTVRQKFKPLLFKRPKKFSNLSSFLSDSMFGRTSISGKEKFSLTNVDLQDYILLN